MSILTYISKDIEIWTGMDIISEEGAKRAARRGYEEFTGKHQKVNNWFKTLDELVNKFNEFVKTDEFEIMHGNIEDRKEISQWGFYWFINWMRGKRGKK